MKYENLSKTLTNRIIEDIKNNTRPQLAFNNEKAIRRFDRVNDLPSVWRNPFIKDIDKIMHCPFYTRYADKTQVFSTYKNIDISRRAFHVQLVSRIARTIGESLNLNLDLIEAIALGHDIGHSPFGHIGENLIDALSMEKASIHFSHNIHSVRVLDKIFPYNITLQTLSGIASHDGEVELQKYEPSNLNDFDELDNLLKSAEVSKANLKFIMPITLEACVVRISDIIAYIGKDRQDAEKLGRDISFEEAGIGTINAEMINNLIVNIIENSYNQPYIALDQKHFNALKKAKAQNYEYIYNHTTKELDVDNVLRPMFYQLYEKLYYDLANDIKSSPIYKHHISLIESAHYTRLAPYVEEDPHRIVIDFIASMTDTYFIEIFSYLFPNSSLKISYKNYF